MTPDVGSNASDVVQVRFGPTGYLLALPRRATDYIQGRIQASQSPYEEHMLTDMVARIRPDELFVDVGANVGNHTICLAVVAGCSVVAFEPNEDLASAMQRSVRLNHLDARVRVVSRAVSDRPGRAKFVHLDDTNLGAQRIGVTNDAEDPIEVLALDDVAWPTRVRMIKIDVEGMEAEVIAGSRGLIGRDLPLIYVECGREDEFVILGEMLGDLGYVPWGTFNATPTHLFGHRSEAGALEAAALDAAKMTRLYIRLFERCASLGSPPGDPGC